MCSRGINVAFVLQAGCPRLPWTDRTRLPLNVGVEHTLLGGFVAVFFVWKDEMGSNPSNTWTAICPMAVCHQSPDRTTFLRAAAFRGGKSPNVVRLSCSFSWRRGRRPPPLPGELGPAAHVLGRGAMMMKLSSLWPHVKRQEHLSICASAPLC